MSAWVARTARQPLPPRGATQRARYELPSLHFSLLDLSLSPLRPIAGRRRSRRRPGGAGGSLGAGARRRRIEREAGASWPPRARPWSCPRPGRSRPRAGPAQAGRGDAAARFERAAKGRDSADSSGGARGGPNPSGSTAERRERRPDAGLASAHSRPRAERADAFAAAARPRAEARGPRRASRPTRGADAGVARADSGPDPARTRHPPALPA